MGDKNQYKWLASYKDGISGPILEVGSRHYDRSTSNDFRDLLDGHDYVGVDMSEGDNVDFVVDFTKDFDEIDQILGGRRFKTAICLSVMEHVDDIFSFAKNLSNVIETNGVLALSVPFAWRFHGYPSDYWRFTPKAVEYLFPDFEFVVDHSTISSNAVGDMEKLQENPNNFTVRKSPKKSFFDKLLGRTTAKLPPYMLAPTMLNLWGKKLC